MAGSTDGTSKKIVDRLLHNWRSGRDTTIDEAVEELRDGQDARSLRERVVELLGQQTVHYEPSGAGEPSDADSPDEIELPGYDIVDLLGRGGMGAVYEAYQQSTSRRVAVKFMLDRGGNQAGQRERFEREVDLCARLQHPHIVSIIDSGVHKSRLYYVMEHVEGERLDDRFTPGECDLGDLLAVMCKISRAVDYAHQRGVLHRDLKPGNILIDEQGEPHLLDFGLAKAIDPTSGGGLHVSISEPGQLLGTIAYMAPEQSQGDFEQMSVRSDVYSLGAITYELLTGKLPCEIDGPLSNVLRGIAERPPPRPSTISRKSNTDIDAILLKALEKSPNARYATAAEFADDIERHLKSETILARRAGPLLRTARWYKRNRVVATVGLAAVLTLLIGGSLAYWNISAKQQTLLKLQVGQNRAIESADFTEGYEVAIPKLFNEFVVLASELDGQPQYRSDLLASLGVAFRSLSEFDTAREVFEDSLQLAEQHYPKQHPKIIKTHHNLASVLWFLGQYDVAETHYVQAVDGWRRIYENGWRRQITTGDVEIGKNLARSLDHLSSTYSRQFRSVEAIEVSREALAFRLQLLGEQNIDVVMSYNNLARILNSAGKLEEVPELCDNGLRIIESIHGRDHQGVASLLQQKGRAMLESGDLAGAEQTLLEALEVKERILLPDHVITANTIHDLALINLRQGNFNEARALAQRAFNTRIRAYSGVHEELAESLVLEGRLALLDEHFETAESRIADAINMYKQLWQGRRTWQLLEAESVRAEIEAAQGHTEVARSMLQSVLTELQTERPPPSRVWTETSARLESLTTEASATR